MVNAQKALNMRPGLTTSGMIGPNVRKFSYTYKETVDGEEVDRNIDFTVGKYFLPGDTRSISFNAWVKSGEIPEISFEVYGK